MATRQPIASGPRAARPLGALRRPAGLAISILLQLLRTMAQRYRQRRALAQLNDAELRDIGLARHEAEAEAQKPFWMA